MDTQLKKCQENFSKWRLQRTDKKRQTPRHLRAEAVALLATCSLEALSTALEIPLSTLKSWRYASIQKKETVDFITLPFMGGPPVTSTAFDCRLDFGNGIQLSFNPSMEAMVHLLRSLVKEPLSCSI
jgi:hypothetical protein